MVSFVVLSTANEKNNNLCDLCASAVANISNYINCCGRKSTSCGKKIKRITTHNVMST